MEPIFPVAGRESCSSCSSLSLRPSVIHPSHPSLSVSSAPLLTAEGKSLGALVLLCYLSDVTTQEMIWLTCWGALHIKCWMGRYSYPKCNGKKRNVPTLSYPLCISLHTWEQMNVMNIHSFTKQGCSFRSQESEWSPSGESTPLALRILGGKLPSVGANPTLLGDKIKRHLPGEWKGPSSS